MTQLTYDVHVCPGIPTSIDDLPPGMAQRMWSPIASTLIAGERDAVLVDPPMTAAQADALVAWLDRQGKNVTTIYITHGHGDHWFGISAVLRRFPQARAVATAGVVAYMERNGSPQMLESF